MLGYPYLFLTFNTVDIHWDSLYKYMPNYEAWKEATGREKMRIVTENIKDNPYIIAYHFYERFNQFMTHVLIPKFGIVNYWNRYEWQDHGSPYSHGLIWLKTDGRGIPI